jgi:CHASE2 domain-containing sensor protein
MNRPSTIVKTLRRNSLAGGLMCLALTLLLWYSVLGDPWLRWSYDLGYLLRPATAPPAEVVVVFLDNKSYEALGQRAADFDRGLLADFVDRMTDDGANLVVLDIWFQLPRSIKVQTNLTEAGDRKLARAIERNRMVVLATVTEERAHAELNISTVLPPFPALKEAKAHLGLSKVRSDGDNMVRSFHHGDEQEPGFAWVAAQLAGSQHLAKPGSSPDNELWLNYYGKSGSLKSFSFQDVIGKNSQPKGYFKGANVFVGSLPTVKDAQEITDHYRFPYSRWTTDRISGVEIAATAFANLVRGDSLRYGGYQNQPMHLALVFTTAALFGCGLVWLRPGWAVGISIAGALAVALFSCIWVWKSHVWVNWMLISGMQIPFSLAWSLLSHTRALRQEKEHLEQTLTQTLQQVEETRKEQAKKAAGEAILPAKASPDAASSVADHTLVRQVGKGGYGEVWLARNAIGLHHVVKMVHRRDFNDDGPYEREFRGIQKFMPISRSHPGFVHILHVGRNDERGFFYYIMEPGDDERTEQQIQPDTYTPKNLGTVIRQRGALPAKECVGLGKALADALHCLHQQQLIHRDIKPANIIYVKGQPKLADIGLVTEIQSTAQDVSRLGTDGFMAPEGPGTPASDVYSLGKVLYEACMGLDRRRFPELPTALYESEDITARMELNRIIIRACEPNPENRYTTAAEMSADLAELSSRLEK